MKIEKIILENFAAIKNAQDTNRLEIDFTKANNKICIIIGRNGDGKTTLMSLLNPFADVGNLDVRSNLNLILEDKDGYKEIHIRDNDDLYKIKHFYTHHKGKSHSVKSYIEKNGMDLNPNGNVTSFKEMVKEELQIDMDYLKLIRLGDNVTNLINLSSTERKNYMSKIMVDIGVYLDYYKSINQKMRQLNDMVSHTIDKINKLNILDKDELENEISDLNNKIIAIDNEYDKENTLSGTYKERISLLNPDGDLKDKLQDITKKYKKMNNIIEKNDLSKLSLNKVSKDYETTVNDISKISNTIDANKIIMVNLLDQLDSYQIQFKSLENQALKEEESDKELERMNNNLNSMRLKLREYESNINNFKPTLTSKDLQNFILELRNIQDILERTYEFGSFPVKKVVELLKDKKNVMQYINSHLIELDEKQNNNDSFFLYQLSQRLKAFESRMEIIDKCDKECPAKDIINQLRTLIEDNEIDDKLEDPDNYKNMEYVNNNIVNALKKFSNFEDVINSLPTKLKNKFLLNKIYDKISKLDIIYNEEELRNLLSLTTEYENYEELNKKVNEEEDRLKKFESLSNTDTKSQIKVQSEKIEELKDKISTYKDSNSKLDEEYKELLKDKETLYDIKETLESYTEVKDEYDKLTKDYDDYIKANDLLMESLRKSSELKTRRELLSKELQNKQSSLIQYKDLNKDLNKYNKVYDEMSVIKDSLSSKEGIPLHIISHYLNNTETITNELLNIAYDDKIYIDNFNITPTEFTIPFYNNGVCLPDVKFASQGELSFLSIALSFALSAQSLSKYNIMLLDEIDGPLDTVNREKFIRILENQIDRIDSEQNFLITHNDMFSSYPVDIIDLSGRNNKDEYPMATFLDINKK